VLAGVLLATARNNPGHRHRPPANSRLASQLADLLDAVDEIRPGSLVVMMMMTTTALVGEAFRQPVKCPAATTEPRCVSAIEVATTTRELFTLRRSACSVAISRRTGH